MRLLMGCTVRLVAVRTMPWCCFVHSHACAGLPVCPQCHVFWGFVVGPRVVSSTRRPVGQVLAPYAQWPHPARIRSPMPARPSERAACRRRRAKVDGGGCAAPLTLWHGWRVARHRRFRRTASLRGGRMAMPSASPCQRGLSIRGLLQIPVCRQRLGCCVGEIFSSRSR